MKSEENENGTCRSVVRVVIMTVLLAFTLVHVLSVLGPYLLAFKEMLSTLSATLGF